MTTEEKAKAYDNIIEKANKMHSENCEACQICIEELIPELKESGDERIKKAIKYGLDYVFTNNTTVYETTKEQCLAYLEKQGKHANFCNKIQIGDKVTRNRDGVLVNLSQLNRVAKKDEKQGEQKPTDKVEPKFKVGQTIKKEGFNLGFTIVKIEDSFYYNDIGDYFPFTDQDNWELVESAWSEEDEKNLRVVVDYLIADNGLTLKHINWLKSLKDKIQPRPKWKPSDEQLEYLLTIKTLSPSPLLKSLYIDLKKLREELL